MLYGEYAALVSGTITSMNQDECHLVSVWEQLAELDKVQQPQQFTRHLVKIIVGIWALWSGNYGDRQTREMFKMEDNVYVCL